MDRRLRREIIGKLAGIAISDLGTREWLDFTFPSAMLRVYVRRAARALEKKDGNLPLLASPCLDIADATVTPTGQKTFTQFLQVAEAVAARCRVTLYVESVTESLGDFLQRRGYDCHNPARTPIGASWFYRPRKLTEKQVSVFTVSGPSDVRLPDQR